MRTILKIFIPRSCLTISLERVAFRFYLLRSFRAIFYYVSKGAVISSVWIHSPVITWIKPRFTKVIGIAWVSLFSRNKSFWDRWHDSKPFVNRSQSVIVIYDLLFLTSFSAIIN